MKKFRRSLVIVAMAAAAVILFGSVARAGITSDTIAIKFGITEPLKDGSLMDPFDVAGVPGIADTGNWNNAVPLALSQFEGSQYVSNLGRVNNLVRDTNGVATTTSASVTWSAQNTWASSGRGEENNTFPGDNGNPSPNRKLMLGYLDQETGGQAHAVTRIDITGLPDDMALGFKVIIYEIGGTGSRGGTYTVNGMSQTGTSGDAVNGSNGPTFVLDPGDGSAPGNYLLFTGLSGSTVRIRARNDNSRAVINGIEIVKTP